MILIISLSPAWQRTLFFDTFLPGKVNRATRVIESASGKGVNVARVLNTLGVPVCLLTVAGGHRGKLFQQALNTEDLGAHVLAIKGETRLCQTLITPGLITEVVEEAAGLSPREMRTFLACFTSAVKRASLVVLSGSVPKTCGNDVLARLARISRTQGVPVLADTQGAPLLNLVKEQPDLVKINRAELGEASGQATLAGGARELMRRGAGLVVISDGARAVTAFAGGKCWKVIPPAITAVNPIGSGDAMLAGLAAGMATGQVLTSALELGIACGAANALTEMPGGVKIKDVKRLMRTFKPVRPTPPAWA
ncbi:MAG: 1-phosphofructokinase family hexose kinase [bacterium]